MSELSNNLHRLFDVLVSGGLTPPSGDVRLVEIRNGVRKYDDRGRVHICRDELRKPSDYEGRFEELLQMGFGWVNLSCYGVYQTFLIVGVEVPAKPAIVMTLQPEFRTPVNLSGPSNHSLEQGWSVDGNLVIDDESRPS